MLHRQTNLTKYTISVFLQDLPDITTLESKWDNLEPKKTPDIDQMDIEQYQVGLIYIKIIWRNNNKYIIGTKYINIERIHSIFSRVLP